MITDIEKINNLIKGFPTITMYRINYNGKRGYVATEPFRVYSGLTSALSAATFRGHMEAKRLDKWRDKMINHLGGQEVQESYLNSMADFGTLCHMTIVKIKENGKLVWAEEQAEAALFFEQSAKENGIIPNRDVIKSQVDEFCKTAASILQFVHENVVEIHSVEGMAKHDVLEIATPIDFVVTIRTKKGDKRVSVNLKTSGQFSHHHREQVAVERSLWNTTYPNFQIDNTALLRAKDWNMKKGIPTYEFEILDSDEEQQLLDNAVRRLMLAKSDESTNYANFNKTQSMFVGETKLGEAPQIGFKTIEQLFNESLTKEI